MDNSASKYILNRRIDAVSELEISMDFWMELERVGLPWALGASTCT